MPRLLTGVFTIGLLFLCQVSVSHAGNIFLLLPGVPGESVEKSHPGWIDVRTVSWGHGEGPIGSLSKAAQFRQVAIVKFNDSTSASLALLGATGQPIKEVKLEITRLLGTGPVATSRMKLTNARVASYTASVTEGGDTTEQLTFSFDTITWIHFKFDKGLQLPGSAACWDVVNNKVCVPQF
jgi:type VI protein secretion system component Hcp